MCGICGMASRIAPLDAGRGDGLIATMVDALVHRGPDDAWIERSPSAVMGATRLAIRGIASGRQPILDPESGVLVACNGEIDNHEELRGWLAGRGRPVRQATDVAVIPGLYLELGESFVERLVGAFAIGLWDPKGKRLILARDRAGERPLFYHVEGGIVRFATEISALAADPALRLTPDRTALAAYLRFGSFVAPETPFAEIRKVGPAEIIRFDGDGIHRKRYWRWEITTTPKRTPSIEAFDEVFRSAVHRQGDVEVDCGVFLSGGIDSSLVAAVARRVWPERRYRAYTLRFGEASYDEGAFAEQVARDLGIEAVPVWIHAEDFPRGIAELVRLVGEPLADPAWIPTAFLARRASQDVKLALVGEGGDELFGGYPTYIGARVASRYARLPAPLRAILRAGIAALPPSDKKVTLSFLLKRFVAGAELDGVERHLLWTANLAPSLLARLGLEPQGSVRPAETGDLLDIVQRIDLETSLAEGLLTKADRASMRSALELRAPFLDQAIMEFAATLPPRERLRGVTTKAFLKRYALGYLPARIVHRKKRGLSVPLSGWLRGELYSWAAGRLEGGLLDGVGIDSVAARDLLEEHRTRKADHARALWTLLVLTEWTEWARERAGGSS
jgi:asparagine synthase (glutamine-hydrolysing)